MLKKERKRKGMSVILYLALSSSHFVNIICILIFLNYFSLVPGVEPVTLEQGTSQPEPVVEVRPESVVEDQINNVEGELETTASVTVEEIEPPGATPSQLAEDTDVVDILSSVSDPSSVNIEKLLQGEVVLDTEDRVLDTEDSEEMAEAKHVSIFFFF